MEHLEGSDIQWRYKGAGGELVNNLFNYHEISGNHFNYIYQVDGSNNRRHYHISFKRTWAKNYWPNRCHAYFLALAEVNENYLRGYLVDIVDVDPQLEFLAPVGMGDG